MPDPPAAATAAAGAEGGAVAPDGPGPRARDSRKERRHRVLEEGRKEERRAGQPQEPPEALLPSERADFKAPAPAVPVWWWRNAFALCGDGEEHAYEDMAMLLDTSEVTSLREAADLLNRGGRAECQEDFCVARDAEDQEYFVLHRFGARRSALERFGIQDPGPPPSRSAEPGAGATEVLVRHGIQQGVQIRLVVPRRARFRHLKLALARHLDNDEILRRGFFVQRVGTYTNHKDDSRVADLKEVLVAGISICDVGDERPATVLEDGEVTSDDEEAEVDTRGSSWVAKLEEKLAKVEERQVKATGSKLTYKDAISINQELLEGFRDETFQQQLRALSEANCSKAEFLRKRQELFLFVQRKVLPRYGFEGSQTGVLKMIGEMRPYVDIPQFAKLRQEIYGLLGLEMPERSAKDFSKDCAELAVADAQLAAGVRKSYIASRIS